VILLSDLPPALCLDLRNGADSLVPRDRGRYYFAIAAALGKLTAAPRRGEFLAMVNAARRKATGGGMARLMVSREPLERRKAKS
jgi:hypothetical protein